MAKVFLLQEEFGVCPTVCTEGDVSLVPREGQERLDSSMRPITVLATLQSLYAIIRLRRGLFQW